MNRSISNTDTSGYKGVCFDSFNNNFEGLYKNE